MSHYSSDLARDIIGGNRDTSMYQGGGAGVAVAIIIVIILIVAVVALYLMKDRLSALLAGNNGNMGNVGNGNGNVGNGNGNVGNGNGNLPPPSYASRGCWLDTRENRSLNQTLFPAGGVNDSLTAVQRCADAAKAGGHKVFGLQWGGICRVDDDPNKDYRLHGEQNCETTLRPGGFAPGTGGNLVTHVYEWDRLN